MRHRSKFGLAALVGAAVLIGGCGDPGSGNVGLPDHKNPGQATQGGSTPIAKDKPAPQPKG